MKRLIHGALEQRVTVNLLFLLFMLLGGLLFLDLPVDAWPDVSLDEAWITTVWDGAGAGEVEGLLTRKIEEEISDLAGIRRLVSDSLPGISIIDVKFDEDLKPSELEAAFSDLRAALERVVDLPREAEPPVLRRLTTSEVYPIFSVIVYACDEGLPEIVLRETARELKKVLSEVPGVQRVRFEDFRERELRVLVDRLAARRHRVSLPEVVAALQQTNRSHPAGSIRTEEAGVAPVSGPESARGSRGGAGEEVRVKLDAELRRPEDLERAVVRLLPGKAPLGLQDVARVVPGFEDVHLISRLGGHRAVDLGVAKSRDSDTVRLRDGCWIAIQELARKAPAGVGFEIVGDQSEVVRSRFRVLLTNLLEGTVLVALILFFALGLRNALIALVGIPFSYLAGFLVYPLLGLSINNLTLFGMVLVGGMLVDDAIITIENIYRHVEKGTPLSEAVRAGASEIAWPVVNACLTTIAALSPLLLQGGVIGRFFAFIPKAVIVALLASVVQCVFVLPVHYLDFGSRLKTRRGRAQRLREAVFGSGRRLYSALLERVLDCRAAFLTLTGGVSILLVGLVLQIPQDPWASDFNAVFTSIKCDPSYSLAMTDAASRAVEKELGKLQDEGLLKNYYTIVGFRMTPDGVFIRRPDVAFFMGTLAENPRVTSDPERVVNRLRRSLEEEMRGGRAPGIVAVEVFTPHDGPPLGKPVAVRVESNDYLEAQRVAGEIQAELRRIDGVFGVADNLDLGPREFRFVPDRERAAALGFLPQEVATALRAANDGIVAGSFKDRKLDEDVAIRVQYDPADRASPEALLLADARGATPALVPLADLTRVEVWRPNASYYHYDTRRTVLVTADVDGTVATGPQVNEHLQRVFHDVPQRYPGVRLVFGGEFEETQRSMAEQRRSFWIALVLIYVLLAAQFKSTRQPLVVMAVVPFGVLGVLLGLWVRSQPFTIATFIAMIGLAGVVVNDSLVLVEFINLRRAEGLGLREAVVTAARERFRPVLLAGATTIGNLLPLAVGLGGTSRVWTPFAVSIVFGISVAGVMTLFMVPVLYTLTEKAERRCG